MYWILFINLLLRLRVCENKLECAFKSFKDYAYVTNFQCNKRVFICSGFLDYS